MSGVKCRQQQHTDGEMEGGDECGGINNYRAGVSSYLSGVIANLWNFGGWEMGIEKSVGNTWTVNI